MQALQTAIKSLQSNQTGAFKIDKDRLLVATPNALVLRSSDECNRETNNILEQILAIRVNGCIVGNSDRLRDKQGQDLLTNFQQPLSQIIPMIPFQVMREAGLSLKDYREVERGAEETVFVNSVVNGITRRQYDAEYANKRESKITYEYKGYANHDRVDMVNATYRESRHFTGARLFSIGTEFFLMDIDRNEIQYGIFNAFLVKLNKPCATIAEAYESLKPQVVLDAEKQGLEVKRQGEWFLIPTDNTPLKHEENGFLQAGNNRPNRVEFFADLGEKKLVKGEISHAGREHKTIVLKTWHVAVPNTSVTSWQLNGDID